MNNKKQLPHYSNSKKITNSSTDYSDSSNIFSGSTSNYQKLYKGNEEKNIQINEQYNKLKEEYSEARDYLIKNYFKGDQNINLPLLEIITIILNSEAEKYKKLDDKYNKTFDNNRHNFNLLKDMKSIIIEKGNLQGQQKKYGGIEMTKLAFENKDKQINELSNENEKLKGIIKQNSKMANEKIKQKLISQMKDGYLYSKSSLEVVIGKLLSEKEEQIHVLNDQLGQFLYSKSTDYSYFKKKGSVSYDSKELLIKAKFAEKGFIDKQKCSMSLESFFDEVLNNFDEKINNLQNEIETLQSTNSENEEKISKTEEELKKYKDLCKRYNTYVNKIEKIKRQLIEGKKINEKESAAASLIIPRYISELENKNQSMNEEIQNLIKANEENKSKNDNDQLNKIVKIMYLQLQKLNKNIPVTKKLTDELNTINKENLELKKNSEEFEILKQKLIEDENAKYQNLNLPPIEVIKQVLFEKDKQIQELKTRIEDSQTTSNLIDTKFDNLLKKLNESQSEHQEKSLKEIQNILRESFQQKAANEKEEVEKENNQKDENEKDDILKIENEKDDILKDENEKDDILKIENEKDDILKIENEKDDILKIENEKDDILKIENKKDDILKDENEKDDILKDENIKNEELNEKVIDSDQPNPINNELDSVYSTNSDLNANSNPNTPTDNADNNENQSRINLLESELSKAIENENNLRNQIVNLNKKLKEETLKKEMAEDLMRRHFVLIQTENDKQLRRIRYIQQQEIKEIIENLKDDEEEEYDDENDDDENDDDENDDQ